MGSFHRSPRVWMDVVLRDGRGEPGFPTRLLACRVRACESGCRRARRFRIARRRRRQAERAHMAPAASRSLFVSVRRRALPCPEHDVPVKTWASGDGAGVALDWTPGSDSRGVEALCGHVRHGRERWYGAESADSSLARKWRPRQVPAARRDLHTGAASRSCTACVQDSRLRAGEGEARLRESSTGGGCWPAGGEERR